MRPETPSTRVSVGMYRIAQRNGDWLRVFEVPVPIPLEICFNDRGFHRKESTVMPFSLADYFQKQGLRVVEAALRAVDGKPSSYVRDEHHYRMQVIQPTWRALPLGVRMLLKREVERFDELLLSLRDEVFDLSGQSVEMRPN